MYRLGSLQFAYINIIYLPKKIMGTKNKSSMTATTSNVVVVTNPKEKAFFFKLRERKMESLRKLEAIGMILNNVTK